ncbi:MAG: hypothetical protein KDD53_01265 [Bdellovibrionales bacterium]|nr:hypothetical protein [Bdellovibrionales bacterium]
MQYNLKVHSLIFRLVCILFASNLYLRSTIAQSPQLIWSSISDNPGTSTEFPQGVAVDRLGNTYMLSTAYTFNPSNPADMQVVKYNRQGVLQWQISHDGGLGQFDLASDIVVKNGDIYALGTSVFSPTSNAIAVVKYSSDGTQKWVSNIGLGSSLLLGGIKLAIADNGNIYVCGRIVVTPTDVDWVIAKVRPTDGALLWMKQWGGTSQLQEYPTDITVDRDENVYVSGFDTKGPFVTDAIVLSFDKSGTLRWTAVQPSASALKIQILNPAELLWSGITNNYNLALTKLDLGNGHPIWQKTYDAPAALSGVHITVTSDGTRAIVASEEGWPDTDWRVASFKTSNGDLEWSYLYEGVSIYGLTDLPHGIVSDGNGNVFVLGEVQNPLVIQSYFDVESDIALIKLDKNGVKIGEAFYNGTATNNDVGTHIVFDSKTQRVLITGWTSNSLDPGSDIYTAAFK